MSTQKGCLPKMPSSSKKVVPEVCLVCDEAVEWSEHHVHDAVIFTSLGNYGSTTFDEVNAQAAIAVCDDCMKRRGSAVLIRRRLPSPPIEYHRVGDLHDYLAGAE